MNRRIIDDIAANEAVLLDVRRDDEWNAGYVKGAQHFDVSRLRQGEMPAIDINTPVYTYCRSGMRAEEAAKMLTKMGFKHARSVGGLNDWIDAVERA